MPMSPARGIPNAGRMWKNCWWQASTCITTLNVQHLESLNDVVGQITGIRVRETLPDKVFDQADEVMLVDLPADELLRRLREGKVYLPSLAEQASEEFFSQGQSDCVA